MIEKIAPKKIEFLNHIPNKEEIGIKNLKQWLNYGNYVIICLMQREIKYQ